MPLHARLNVINELSDKPLVCTGGFITALQQAIGTLKATRSGIGGAAMQRKTSMVEASALAHVKRTHRYHAGSEVHIVNAYLDHSADHFGLAKRMILFPLLSQAIRSRRPSLRFVHERSGKF